ncbi:MAG TPA: MmgE/PrpD family protein [Streptosporangiaceae bacterium]|jgi:2-methylcitrate dehydratase PrpD
MTGFTRALAEFAAGPEPGDGAARHAAARIVAGAVPLMVGASAHPAVERVLGVAGRFGAPRQAGVLGRGERLGVAGAALVNGVAAHVEDFDDTHLDTVLHPGAPIVAAALAIAEWTDATGDDLIAAVLTGTEAAIRTGNAICPEHFDRGWHVTGTLGHLGAAAAAGRLLGLGPDRMEHALGLAATQAAGLTSALGTMTKSFHAGKAAADGVEAALLARRGYTAAPAAVEGRRGMAALMSDRFDPAALDGLGDHWETARVAFKPYACGIVAHPAIDAAVALHGGDPSAITAVDVRANPVVEEVMGVVTPHDALTGKFSIRHAVAAGLVRGAAGPAEFTDEAVRDPAIARIRGLVRVATDAAVAKDAGQVTVRTADGSRTREIAHATGSEYRPMPDGELRAKGERVAGPVLGGRTGALMDALAALGDGGARGRAAHGTRHLVAAARPAVPT